MLTVSDVMNMKKQKDIDGLIQALQDQDIAVRAEAASSLGQLSDRTAVVPLISALQSDSDPYVRSLIAKSLGELGDPRALDPLRNAIMNDTMEVSLEAGKAAGLLAMETQIGIHDKPADEIAESSKIALGVQAQPADKIAESKEVGWRAKLWRAVYVIGIITFMPGCMLAAFTIYGLMSPNVVVEDLPVWVICSGVSMGLGFLLMKMSNRRTEPEQPAENEKPPKTPPKSDGVRFLRKYTKPIIAGFEGTYMEYEAGSLEEARTFLATQSVTVPRFYVEIYTPEGGVGKDIDSTYEFDV